jgi:hypothetical protein
MTEVISPALQTTLLILTGLALLAAAAAYGGRWLRRWRGRRAIRQAQEAGNLPEPWRSLRDEVEASNRVLTGPIFHHARQIFLDYYSQGGIQPPGMAAERGNRGSHTSQSFVLVVDEHGRPMNPYKALVERYQKTKAAQPMFQAWFREAVFEDGQWAGLRTLLTARWLCEAAGLRYAAAQILLDLPGENDDVLARQVAEGAEIRYDLLCAAVVEGMERPEAALEMEMQEACSLGFADLSDLRLAVRYNSYTEGTEAAATQNEHRLLYRAQVKPDSLLALRLSDGSRPGLVVVAASELRRLAQSEPGRLTSGLLDAIGYYEA